MLSQQMTQITKIAAFDILKSNPFSVAAAEGRVTEDQMTTYLYNLRWIFANHPKFIRKAEERSKELRLNKLSNFYKTKFEEEVDHHKWAEDDLRARQISFGDVFEEDDPKVLWSSKRIMLFLNDIIEDNPANFLAYVFFVEYFSILVGGQFLENLESRCGIPKGSVSAINKHIVTDQKHVVEDIQLIDELGGEISDQQQIIQSLYRSIGVIDRFLADCVGNA